MLDEVEALAQQGWWEQVKEKMVEIYKCQSVFTEKIKERINRLEARLLKSQSVQISINKKILVVLIGASLLTIGILFWLFNNWLKEFLIASKVQKN
jgi:hypothetical protein